MTRAKQFADRVNSLLKVKTGREFAQGLMHLCDKFEAKDISAIHSNLCWKVDGVNVAYTKNKKFHVSCSR